MSTQVTPPDTNKWAKSTAKTPQHTGGAAAQRGGLYGVRRGVQERGDADTESGLALGIALVFSHPRIRKAPNRTHSVHFSYQFYLPRTTTSPYASGQRTAKSRRSTRDIGMGGKRDSRARRARRVHVVVVLTVLASSLSPLLSDQIYWTANRPSAGGGKVQRSNPDGSALTTILEGLSYPAGIAVHPEDGKLYWSEGRLSGWIRRVNLDGSGIAPFLRTYSEGLILDPTERLLYVVRSADPHPPCHECGPCLRPLPGSIYRVSLDDPSRECVAVGYPAGPIALDRIHRKLYWLEFEVTGCTSLVYRIVEANLDGSDRREVLDVCPVSGLAVAPQACKIYWSCDHTILRAGLDGSGVEPVVTTASAGTFWDPTRLAIAQGKIYWTEIDRIRRADLDGSNLENVVTGLERPNAVALDFTDQGQGQTPACDDGTDPATHTVCPSGCDFDSIQEAADAADDGDTLDLPAGVFTENVFIHSKTLTIDGAGRDETIVDGNAAGPVFYLSRSDVTLANLTVRNGSAIEGGGIVHSGGYLELKDSVIRENSATSGGGLSLNGGARISRTLITGNESLSGSAITFGLSSYNGGCQYPANVSESTITGNSGYNTLYNQSGRPVITNTTISGNSGAGAFSYAYYSTSMTFSNSTVSGNDIGLDGGGAPGFELKHTIVADNLQADCSEPVQSLGYNLSGDASCGFDQPTDLPNIDPLLEPLADNGGPTPTHALAPGSPAIDAGGAVCEPTDQRGAARPQDGDGDGSAQCEIGAFENQPPVAVCRDVTVHADENCLAGAAVDAGSSDPDGDPVTLGQSPPGPYGPGQTVVTLTVTDDAGAVDSCTATVIVEDATPPELSVALTPDTLWPPNHRMVDVEASWSASDNCGPPSIVLTSVGSNEADNGEGDGNTVNDIQDAAEGTADGQFRLRAERAGGGQGRIYTATYTAADASGNATAAAGHTVVPHDQGGTTDPIEVRLERSDAGTRLSWNPAEGALSYAVVRGRLSEIVETAVVIDLGLVTCIEAASVDTTTAGSEDSQVPPVGQGFFYLVEYFEGTSSSYGTESASKPRVPTQGACQ